MWTWPRSGSRKKRAAPTIATTTPPHCRGDTRERPPRLRSARAKSGSMPATRFVAKAVLRWRPSRKRIW
jgi:hypothetical protein